MQQEVQATEIVDALLKHPTLKFKDKGQYLRDGECPECGKRELYVRKSQPWRIACSRESKCGYAESARELVPELFTNYVERFPKSDENPNATADAYLSHNRQFDLLKIRGCYEQATEYVELEKGKGKVYVESIRFYLNPQRTRYWSRLIDKTKADGQKAHFAGQRKPDGSLYRGDVWVPPGMDLKKGDKVYIVEGIFHSIAMCCNGFNAVAAFTCNNFPQAFIEQNKHLDIFWCVALDEGEAGRKYARKFIDQLKKLKQRGVFTAKRETRLGWLAPPRTA